MLLLSFVYYQYYFCKLDFICVLATEHLTPSSSDLRCCLHISPVVPNKKNPNLTSTTLLKYFLI